MNPKESKISREEQIRLYDSLVAMHSKATRKGDTVPCTTLNGHMYSYFTKDNFLALRLPEAEKLKFLEKYKTTLVQQYGITQKEYVVVPAPLLQKTQELSKWFEISFNYVSALKPKPAAKKKK